MGGIPESAANAFHSLQKEESGKMRRGDGFGGLLQGGEGTPANDRADVVLTQADSGKVRRDCPLQKMRVLHCSRARHGPDATASTVAATAARDGTCAGARGGAPAGLGLRVGRCEWSVATGSPAGHGHIAWLVQQLAAVWQRAVTLGNPCDAGISGPRRSHAVGSGVQPSLIGRDNCKLR